MTQDKWSASVRLERSLGGRPAYGLAEWVRTTEAGGAFVFNGQLLEGAMTLGPVRPYLRLEHTDRPEEPRSGDVFRTPRPLLDNSLLGITRWSMVTLGSTVTVLTAGRHLSVAPFIEGAVADVRTISGTFDVVGWYGSHTLLSLSAGVRVDWGMPGHRMGRYGTGNGSGKDAMNRMTGSAE